MKSFHRHGQMGRLIVLCGLDGAGKTTQLEALEQALEAQGKSVVCTRQPTDWYRSDETVRRFLAQGGTVETARAAALFAAADRALHQAEVIGPALRSGAWVLCDRYVFSSIAYFAHRGLDPAWVRELNRDVYAPDLALFLDLSPEVSLARIRRRDGAATRYEERSAAVLGQIRSEFLEHCPELTPVDADRPATDLTQALLTQLARLG